MALDKIIDSIGDKLAKKKRDKVQEYRPEIEKYDLLGNLY